MIGWVVLTGLVIARRKKLRYTRKGLLLSMLAGALIGTDMILWSTGIMISGPTLPTLLGNTTPLWVGLAAMLIYKEKHPPFFWVGLLIALAGAAVILGKDALFDGSPDIGAMLGLVSSLFYSGYFLVLQRTRGYSDSLTSLWVVTFSGGVVLLLVSLALGHPLTGYPPRTVVIFVIMGSS